jgi:MEDS: MEthanogen/methylotroph, DcmR Sensory domain/STAS domain
VGDTGEGRGVRRSHIHLCQVFDGRTEFSAAAVAFLADGLARGRRVRYVADGHPDELRSDITALTRLPEAQRPGAVEVAPVRGSYAGPNACVDASTQVEAYAGDTTSALADGFTGFRVAAEVTMLVRTPAQLDAFARYEHQADRLMARAPFSAMCGYQRSELGDDAVTQLACLHPGGGGEQAPFRMHATAGADIALSGELDLTTVDLFAGSLDRTGVADGAGEVVIDASGLEFADHRNLLVLERMADRYGRSVVLHTSRRWPVRLVAALALSRVRVEHHG